MTFTNSIALGFGMAIGMALVVWLSGATFGQRCTALGKSGQAWEQCVHDLSQGKTP